MVEWLSGNKCSLGLYIINGMERPKAKSNRPLPTHHVVTKNMHEFSQKLDVIQVEDIVTPKRSATPAF